MTNAFAQWVAAGAPRFRLQEIEVVCKSTYAIVRLVGDALEDQRLGRQVCAVCGCLCLPAEVCPGCRAASLVAATAEAQALWRAAG